MPKHCQHKFLRELPGLQGLYSRKFLRELPGLQGLYSRSCASELLFQQRQSVFNIFLRSELYLQSNGSQSLKTPPRTMRQTCLKHIYVQELSPLFSVQTPRFPERLFQVLRFQVFIKIALGSVPSFRSLNFTFIDTIGELISRSLSQRFHNKHLPDLP